ncbi:hypothetical protein [Coraliomargarita parva]|uniref:hypothetical protein n=1 Tax=Coraliomargarita parva TaxID=3014050 RepID=UPI0022B38787|nr:hypothetical protein [Coraliomargarita parva]
MPHPRASLLCILLCCYCMTWASEDRTTTTREGMNEDLSGPSETTSDAPSLLSGENILEEELPEIPHAQTITESSRMTGKNSFDALVQDPDYADLLKRSTKEFEGMSVQEPEYSTNTYGQILSRLIVIVADCIICTLVVSLILHFDPVHPRYRTIGLIACLVSVASGLPGFWMGTPVPDPIMTAVGGILLALILFQVDSIHRKSSALLASIVAKSFSIAGAWLTLELAGELSRF